ncbi:hypothetical protein Mapa_017151 [Marchantia paleacea]|nr:hypothetical protein Mapa_017151 [Marchantia paleacea]
MLNKGSAAAAAVGGDEVPLKVRRNNFRSTLRERREAETQDSALEYEQERADNIRRNKEFLAQLGLSSTLHSMSAKKSNRGRIAGSKSQAAAAAAELYENSKHHNVEEIMLQLCALRAAAAAHAHAHALGTKRPRLFEPSDDESDQDDEDDDDEEEEEGDGDGDGESETAAVHVIAGRRPKKNPRSSKRMLRNKNLLNEQQQKKQQQQQSKSKKSKKSLSKATSSSSEMSRGKSSKDMMIASKNNPRAGRRRTIPSAVIHGLTSSNQELIRFVSELITSASHSLPPTLLGSNACAAAAGHDGHDSDQSARRDNDSDRGDYYTSHDDDSPRGPGGDSARKRKDTWLTMIPFETPKTEYELERDEILRRHKHHFERLGIVSELIEEPQPPRAIRPYCRRWASEPDPAYQRNTRFQDRQRRTSMQPDREASAAAAAAAALTDTIALTGTRSLLEVHSVSCASSLVANFTGGSKLQTSHGASGDTAKLEATDMEVSSFQPQDGTWLDPDLNRIYTMDLAPISASSPKTGLLAAGGSQGRLAVFAVSDADTDTDSTSKTPLLAWTVDSSWVSQVVFLSNQFQENGTLLLSSSNDGRVVLWDINKQRVRSGSRGLSPLTREGIPVVVCESSTLHSGGIFGMHEVRGKIATSSEGSVAISTIRETGIMVERSIAGHHAGVIRSVRFREQNILADCGVDTVIGILDLRASDPCTLRIQTMHKTGISMVEWSPVCVESNLVLSASNDPQLYLHDIRYTAKAMLQLEGHVHPRRVKCYSIYRPTFVAGGDAVVSPGEGTHQLSLYSVTTGSALKKLHVGYDPNILLWNSAIPRQGGVWAGSRGITKFQALWRQRGASQVQT